ncbi:hypothetical protein LTR85_009058 [Meristemomyces frigidus]|nr:hypothetical protein LTR85_009058 [Meristemomyces frigidus]
MSGLFASPAQAEEGEKESEEGEEDGDDDGGYMPLWWALPVSGSVAPSEASPMVDEAVALPALVPEMVVGVEPSVSEPTIAVVEVSKVVWEEMLLGDVEAASDAVESITEDTVLYAAASEDAVESAVPVFEVLAAVPLVVAASVKEAEVDPKARLVVNVVPSELAEAADATDAADAELTDATLATLATLAALAELMACSCGLFSAL